MKIKRDNIEDIVALSSMQEGMLFQFLKDPESNCYLEQLSMDISGEVQWEHFEKAWDFVAESNEMLRAVFRWENVENPVQIILKTHKIIAGYHDFSGSDASERERKLEEVKERDKLQKFDLRGVPFRVTLCKLEKARHVMIISNHHILYDGWSNAIILKEFFESYENLVKGNKLIRSDKTKFKQYIRGIQQRDIAKEEEFWKIYLKGFEGQAGSAKKNKGRDTEISKIGCFNKRIPTDIKNQIEHFILDKKITLAALFYSAWGILLQQYNSNNDIVFDTTVSGRDSNIEGIEKIVGMFANTLPLRVKTNRHERILSFVSHMNEMLHGWGEFWNSSGMSVREHLDKYRIEYLFDSVLVIENYPLDRALMQENSELKVNSFSMFGMNQYELTLVISVFDNIMFDFFYSSALFDQEMIEELAEQVLYILKSIIENPGEDVASLTISTENVKKKIYAKHSEIPRPSVVGHVTPHDSLEKKLVEIWSEIFRINISEIGIDVNFTDFGGHSLKAKVLAMRINEELKVKVPLENIFQLLTIRNIAQFIRENKEAQAPSLPLQAVEKKEFYELSSAQRRFFILHQIDTEGVTFNMPNVIHLEGKIDRKKLENVIKALIDHHESLRTSFHLIAGEPYQKVPDNVTFKLEFNECSETELTQKLEDFIRPFQLNVAPLFRAHLLKVTEERMYLLLDIHHIISDGFSLEILIEQFTFLYQEKQLSPINIQYKDYAAWNNQCLKNKTFKEQENFWSKQLTGFTFTRLPVDTSKSYQRVTGKSLREEIPRTICHEINEFCGRHKVTKFVFLLAIFLIVVEIEIEQQDITIGTPFMNRDHKDLQQLIGVFLNVLLIRSHVNKDDIFEDYLETIKANVINALGNASYPYERLVEEVKKQKNWGQDELFTILFNYFVLEKSISHLGEDVRLRRIDIETVLPKYDLTLYVTEDQDLLHLDLVYKANLFTEYRIQRILRHFRDIISMVLKTQGVKLCDLNIDDNCVLGEINPGIEFYENDELL